MSENFKMLAKTLYGFEPLLARELRNLGAGRVEEGIRNVSFEGDLGFLYKANLCLRTALKVYRPLASFRVDSEKDLYQNIHRLDWPQLFGPRSEEHTSELQSREKLVCRLLLEKKTTH